MIVGVNRYVAEDEQPLELLRIDPALERKQSDRVHPSAQVATQPPSSSASRR